MTRFLDFWADLTGPWLAAFVVIIWAAADATSRPTLLLPYDRFVIDALLAISIVRLAFRGRAS